MTEQRGSEGDVRLTPLLARLGNVVYWLATGVATLFVLGAIIATLMEAHVAVFFGTKDEKWFAFVGLTALAIGSWGIGRAARYILAGR